MNLIFLPDSFPGELKRQMVHIFQANLNDRRDFVRTCVTLGECVGMNSFE